MIYIHFLKDLNPKSAEIESVKILRELKKGKVSFSEDHLRSQFSKYFVNEDESISFEIIQSVLYQK